MSPPNNTKENQAYWDSRVAHHLSSDFYAQDRFMKGESSLRDVELDFLGAIDGLDVLHVQCHFGQDTISMSRMGAQVTGVDFSSEAITTGRRIASELGLDTTFITSDVLHLPDTLAGRFDVIFASFGVIGWHEDLSTWSASVMKCLRPGGRFILIEFHPVLWMWDDDFKAVTYPYMHSDPIKETVNSSYASTPGEDSYDIVTWNHGLAEVFIAMHQEDLVLERFEEYDYSPEPCFNDVIEVAPRRYQIKSLAGKIPMMYGMSWRKKIGE